MPTNLALISELESVDLELERLQVEFQRLQKIRRSRVRIPAAHTLFQEIWLVTRQTRVQLPDSYICAKLVDFAHFAVEELVRHFDVTRSD